MAKQFMAYTTDGKPVVGDNPIDVSRRAAQLSQGEAREILKNIVDCYGVGSTPEKFCEHVRDFMEEGRKLIYGNERR